MTWKRRKLHESQKKAYIESGDITQTQSYKRPKLTPEQQKELIHTGTVTISWKSTITLHKTTQTEQKTKKVLNAHDRTQKDIRALEQQELSNTEKNQMFTYIRWGFVIVYTDGTSSPDNEQGYRLYPGHPSYNYIIEQNIPWKVLKTNDMWQGGFVIKTWINIRNENKEYKILDQMEYHQ